MLSVTKISIIISGVVVEVTKDGFYKIGTQNGVIFELFSRNQIAPAAAEYLHEKDVPQQTISVRAANKKSSLVVGQGFVRCSCTTQCKTNRCTCKNNNVLCNSRCHISLPCCNK